MSFLLFYKTLYQLIKSIVAFSFIMLFWCQPNSQIFYAPVGFEILVDIVRPSNVYFEVLRYCVLWGFAKNSFMAFFIRSIWKCQPLLINPTMILIIVHRKVIISRKFSLFQVHIFSPIMKYHILFNKQFHESSGYNKAKTLLESPFFSFYLNY